MSEVDFLVKVRDGATMIADACQERLEKLAPRGAAGHEDLPADMEGIIWKPSTGPKGPFEIAESKANANVLAFARLTEYLNGHQGRATISNYFVWKFGDTSGSVGRKPTQKQA